MVMVMVMTNTARDILRTLHHVRAAPRLSMIAAVPGAGKSETLLRYTQNTPNTILHEAVSGEGKIWEVAGGLMERLEIGAPSRSLRKARQEIAEAVGAGTTLIIDEGQYLAQKDRRSGTNLETFEWCRAMAEEGSFSLVYSGDLSLLKSVDQLPQLKRRMVRPVIVRKVPKVDVAAIAESRGLVEASIIDALFKVSNAYGGLGDVVSVISHAGLFAGKGAVGKAHILAAIQDLKLTPKGGLK